MLNIKTKRWFQLVGDSSGMIIKLAKHFYLIISQFEMTNSYFQLDEGMSLEQNFQKYWTNVTILHSRQKKKVWMYHSKNTVLLRSLHFLIFNIPIARRENTNYLNNHTCVHFTCQKLFKEGETSRNKLQKAFQILLVILCT